MHRQKYRRIINTISRGAEATWGAAYTAAKAALWAVTVFRRNVEGWNNDMYLKNRDGFFFSHPLWFKGGKSS